MKVEWRRLRATATVYAVGVGRRILVAGNSHAANLEQVEELGLTIRNATKFSMFGLRLADRREQPPSWRAV